MTMTKYELSYKYGENRVSRISTFSTIGELMKEKENMANENDQCRRLGKPRRYTELQAYKIEKTEIEL